MQHPPEQTLKQKRRYNTYRTISTNIDNTLFGLAVLREQTKGTEHSIPNSKIKKLISDGIGELKQFIEVLTSESTHANPHYSEAITSLLEEERISRELLADKIAHAVVLLENIQNRMEYDTRITESCELMKSMKEVTYIPLRQRLWKQLT